MKKIIAAVASVTAIAALAVPALASADVPRYQIQTATFTTVEPADVAGQFNNVWTHNYTVTVNPCNNTFTGTGVLTGKDSSTDWTGGNAKSEKITGQFNADNTVSYSASRDFDGVHWTINNALMDNTPTNTGTETDAIAQTSDGSTTNHILVKVSAPQFTNTTQYRNHGEYVTANGGTDDAAHSCIGMPIH